MESEFLDILNDWDSNDCTTDYRHPVLSDY